MRPVAPTSLRYLEHRPHLEYGVDSVVVCENDASKSASMAAMFVVK